MIVASIRNGVEEKERDVLNEEKGGRDCYLLIDGEELE
jgi:hypothetical protein